MLSDIFSLSFLVSLLASTIRLATPILVPALGQIYTQRAGVLNLSTEGTMLMGAIGGFTAVCATGSLWVGVLAGILSGILFSLIMAWLSVTVRANQVIAAIGLNILAAGLAAYIYRVVFGIRTLPAQIESFSAIHIPVLSDLPVVGAIFFSHNILVYLAFLLVPVTWFVLEKTTFGLKIKAVGEHPRAADSKGVSVGGIRYAAVLIGGAHAGLGGAFMTIAYLNTFTDEASLRDAIAEYMNFYTTERMQSRFGGRTPAEVRADALAAETPKEYPIPINKRIQKYKTRYTA